MPSTQTRRKRRLGEYLTQQRKAASLEPPYVAGILRKSAGTVSKIENGHVRPDWPTLSVLLALYKVTDEQREVAESLWEDARDDQARIEHSAGMGPKYRAFLRSEADTTIARTLEQTVIPGLLQTPRYATATHRAAQIFVRTKGSFEKSVASRIARQQRLQDERDPLRLHAVIDEAVIRRIVGGKETMAEQLRHLETIGDKDNVTIQVIPFGAGEYGAMMSAVTILGFDSPEDPDSVYLEYQGGGQWIEDADDVARFASLFEEIATLALPAEETTALIREQAEALEGR